MWTFSLACYKNLRTNINARTTEPKYAIVVNFDLKMCKIAMWPKEPLEKFPFLR